MSETARTELRLALKVNDDDGARAALAMAHAWRLQGHTVALVFFYGDGLLQMSADRAERWRELKAPLLACATRAARRELAIAEGFEAATLAQWYHRAQGCDRVIDL